MNQTTSCAKQYANHPACELIKQNDFQTRLQRWGQRLDHWRINWRTRRQLSLLDSHQLKDISISIGEARAEANKPFWKD